MARQIRHSRGAALVLGRLGRLMLEVGNLDGARAMSATGTYVRAGLPEVAAALSVLTGELHPLAPEGPRADVNHA